MAMIRGILIDPDARTLTEVQVPHEGDEADWRYIREKVGVEYLETVHYSMLDRLYVDEEGLMNKQAGRFGIDLPAYGNRRALLVGKALVLGVTESGFDTDTTLDLEGLRANVSFLPARGQADAQKV